MLHIIPVLIQKVHDIELFPFRMSVMTTLYSSDNHEESMVKASWYKFSRQPDKSFT